MRALVTGVAGFIGSHLAEGLIGSGYDVVGVDCFTPTYDERRKRDNLRGLEESDAFEFVEADLRTADVGPALDDVDVVFHQAAVPGVRASWSSGFADYVGHNVLATQRLLEAARHADVERVVYASSSSVYGNALKYPTHESDVPRPHSPYGVTKLAGEHLCLAYAGNFGLPVVALRYFSVYGPRQRPDMGIHRIVEAALGRGTFSVFGTGVQVRDVTYVEDVVAANLAAVRTDVPPGTVVNIAGGSEVTLNEVIDLVGELVGREVPIQRAAEQPGDVYRTGGATDAARELLGWEPSTDLGSGLAAQIEWHKRTLG